MCMYMYMYIIYIYIYIYISGRNSFRFVPFRSVSFPLPGRFVSTRFLYLAVSVRHVSSTSVAVSVRFVLNLAVSFRFVSYDCLIVPFRFVSFPLVTNNVSNRFRPFPTVSIRFHPVVSDPSGTV